ncbi:Unknown protein [Striga hermonthica]|uniref:Integrase catalytic domain-containing protein n=1 Tax=Striga hermonthica TaxID=68872 RepID=A0A9N7MSE4_STRHE|nr:Unknown protein [Striga hermonthica]
MEVESLGGSRYFVTFIDDASRKLWVYFLRTKGEVFQYFKRFHAMVERQAGKPLKCLRSDNEGEYTSHEFENYCAEHGIRHEKTVPGTPQHNGVAERINRTTMEKRCDNHDSIVVFAAAGVFHPRRIRLRPLLNSRRRLRLETPHTLLLPSPPAAVANVVPSQRHHCSLHGQQCTTAQTATVLPATSSSYTAIASMKICRLAHRRRQSKQKRQVDEDHPVANLSNSIDGGGGSWPGPSSSSEHAPPTVAGVHDRPNLTSVAISCPHPHR